MGVAHIKDWDMKTIYAPKNINSYFPWVNIEGDTPQDVVEKIRKLLRQMGVKQQNICIYLNNVPNTEICEAIKEAGFEAYNTHQLGINEGKMMGVPVGYHKAFGKDREMFRLALMYADSRFRKNFVMLP